jgi:tape measure domain-containing protein
LNLFTLFVTLSLKDDALKRGMDNAEKSAGGLTGGIKNIIKTVAGLKLVSGAFDIIRDSIGGAIRRYDTLNNYPRVLEQMGFDATDATGSLDKLSNGIQGLPTALDEVARNTQNIALLTGDLEGATDTTLALNNAFLASGSSSADASRGTEQYVKMLSSGTVDMVSWRTLQQTMGYALRETAHAFEFAGESATNDLYSALQDGHITFDDFNDKLITLDTEVGGFAETAKTASGGIETSWTNMRTGVVREITAVIGGVDDALESFGGIEGVISSLSLTFQSLIQTIGSVVVSFLNILIPAIELVMDNLDIIIPVIGTFMGLWGGYKILSFIGQAGSLKDALKEVKTALFGNITAKLEDIRTTVGANLLYAKDAILKGAMAVKTIALTVATKGMALAQKALNLALNANPISIIVGLIAMLVVAIIALWNKSETFRQVITDGWNAIKDIFLAVWGWIKKFFTEDIPEAFDKVVKKAKELVDNVVGFFQDLWSWIKKFFMEDIPEAFNNVVQKAKELVDNVVTFFQELPGKIWEIILKIVEFFSNLPEMIGFALGYVVATIVKFIMDVAEWFASLPGKIWDAIVDAVQKIAEWGSNLISVATEKISELISTVIAWLVELPGKIWDAIVDAIQKFTEWGTNISTVVVEKISELISTVIAWLVELPGKIWDAISGAIQRFTEWGSNLISVATEKINALISGIVAWLVELPGKIWDAISGAVQKIAEWGSQLLAKGLEAMKDLTTGIIDALKDLPKQFMDIGVNLIKGFWEGIKSMGTWIKDKVSGFFKGILGGVGKVFGINSPSKEFIYIGEMNMAGFAKGIEDMEDEVKGTMDGVMGDILDNVDVDILPSVGNMIDSNRSNTSTPTTNAPQINQYITTVAQTRSEENAQLLAGLERIKWT